MPSHPLSMKETRRRVARSAEVLGSTVEQVNAQGRILAQTAGVVNLHTRVLSAGFFGRLLWLVAGRVPAPAVRPAPKAEAGEARD